MFAPLKVAGFFVLCWVLFICLVFKFEISFKITRQVPLLLGNYVHAYKIEPKMMPVENA